LLTGRYPHEAVPGHEEPLPGDMPTVATAFRERGYETAWFGKWHVDGFKGRAVQHTVAPERRGGFDTWIGYENNNAQWDCWVHGHDRHGREVAHQRLPGYETDALTDMLIDHVRGRTAQDRPFFASLSVQPPHDPYVAPEPWMRRHTPGAVRFRPNVPAIDRVRDQASQELAGYYAMVENLDHNIGRLRAALAEAGIEDETILIFFSDHGDLLGSQGQFRKTSPWEEALRVPFVVGGFSRYLVGTGTAPVPVNHVDLAPTSLGLCGLSVPDWMAGTDYSPYYRLDRSMANEPESAYLQLIQPTRHPHSVDRPWRGVVTRDGWKYVCLEHQPWLLFNLREDPYEQANLAHNTQFQREREAMQERLRAWIEQTGDSFPLPALK
jgi:arylsulfatase A-like enzyme